MVFGPLAMLGVTVATLAATPAILAVGDDCKRKIEEAKARVDARIAEREKQEAATQAAKNPLPSLPSPPPPMAQPRAIGPRPYGRSRDLVGAQQRRLEALDRAAREMQEAQARAEAEAMAAAQAYMQPVPVFEDPHRSYASVEPEEAFAMWVSEAIRVTGNEFDRVSDEAIFASYTTYCHINNYCPLEPMEVLQGLIVYSKNMGFVLVDRQDGDGWEMVYGQLNEC